jgi:isoaspartyl peptidase/L-asparaginase-like protein (Ntn-hydrolase superfamily)
VTLDAAYMDGNTLRLGGLISVEGIKNPILAAMKLSEREKDFLLAGRGAEQFALNAGLPHRDMLTDASRERWLAALNGDGEPAQSYRGHDTVCVVALDANGQMGVGTSTSGLFMKEPGRVGDTPIVGSGFYCDSRYGGAAATGQGEDIMRGCLSYEVVSMMRRGATPQEACDEALRHHRSRLDELGDADGGISLIALDPSGQFGASTTLGLFPFAAGVSGFGTSLYRVEKGSGASAARRITELEAEGLASD